MRLIDADALIPTEVHTVVVLKDGREQLESVLYAEQVDDAPTVEPASPWHRVEEELPEIGHSILIWAGGVAMIGKRTDDDMFKGKRYFLIEADGYNYWERVEPGMYWMPIEPPKEE